MELINEQVNMQEENKGSGSWLLVIFLTLLFTGPLMLFLMWLMATARTFGEYLGNSDFLQFFWMLSEFFSAEILGISVNNPAIGMFTLLYTLFFLAVSFVLSVGALKFLLLRSIHLFSWIKGGVRND